MFLSGFIVFDRHWYFGNSFLRRYFVCACVYAYTPCKLCVSIVVFVGFHADKSEVCKHHFQPTARPSPLTPQSSSLQWVEQMETKGGNANNERDLDSKAEPGDEMAKGSEVDLLQKTCRL